MDRKPTRIRELRGNAAVNSKKNERQIFTKGNAKRTASKLRKALVFFFLQQRAKDLHLPGI